MQENKELYFGYFKHISQNIIFNDYVNLLPLNSYCIAIMYLHKSISLRKVKVRCLKFLFYSFYL